MDYMINLYHNILQEASKALILEFIDIFIYKYFGIKTSILKKGNWLEHAINCLARLNTVRHSGQTAS